MSPQTLWEASVKSITKSINILITSQVAKTLWSLQRAHEYNLKTVFMGS